MMSQNIFKLFNLVFLTLTLILGGFATTCNADINNNLFIAAKSGNLNEITRLLNSGANVNSISDQGLTPLHAAAQNGSREVVELLLAKGANVNAKSKYGGTPLLGAVSMNRTDVVALLVANGADVNAKINDGWTAIHLAADNIPITNDGEDIAILLIAKGADIDAKNGEGKTAYDIAFSHNFQNYASLFIPVPNVSNASFDCGKNKTLNYIESKICFFPPLRYFDQKLNEAYIAALKATSNSKNIKTQQQVWLRVRNARCNKEFNYCSISGLVNMYKLQIDNLNEAKSPISLKSHSLDVPSGEVQTVVPKRKVPIGDTPEKRIEFLTNQLVENNPSPRAKSDNISYFMGAMKDSSPKVRKFVASFTYIFDESYLPLVIQLMTSDPDPTVRQSAAMSLSSFITDGEADHCNSVNTIVRHLDEILLGLDDGETSDSVIQILGGRYAGDTPLPCCMATNFKDRVIKVLQAHENVQPTHSTNSGWSWNSDSVLDALKNIRECTPNKN